MDNPKKKKNNSCDKRKKNGKIFHKIFESSHTYCAHNFILKHFLRKMLAVRILTLLIVKAIRAKKER